MGPAESEWEESKLEELERAATADLGDGGRHLALGETAPLCPCRHGCDNKQTKSETAGSQHCMMPINDSHQGHTQIQPNQQQILSSS